MSWQEDLQELDSALAGGSISADEYRRRRDELLASAAPSAAEPPAPQSRSPFPPPFSWQAGPPDATPGGGQGAAQSGGQPQDNAERTQVVRTNGPQDAERTQVVRTNGPQDSDRTQVVPGIGNQGAAQSGGFPAQQVPGPPNAPNWGNSSAPPWGNTDFPSLDAASAWGVKQGPEVFDEGTGGGKGKIIAIVLVLVLLVGAGVGAYFIWGRNGSGGTGDTNTAQPAPTTTTTVPKKVPDGPFVELPSKTVQFKSLPIQAALDAKVPTVEEAQILQQAGVTEVRFVVSRDENTGLVQGIWAFKANDAAAVLTQVDELYQAASFEALNDSPTGVLGRHLPLTDVNKTATYRAHYVTDGFVVRVESYAPSEDVASKAYKTLLQRQVDEFPAG
ncbi:SHOCT domain-containing protein [Umezawaea beigongshangensis]|uniref:SHOCT domain-containing protein n=1 Tax=Umezawaea beigongshangensis TaxID=2780383 RepID=UPI0018F1C120|nr:SHOCT domain-containing protein [Umezawaea beigongshangensis]